METSIRSAAHFAQFAAGAVTANQIAAISPEQAEGHATGLELIDAGSVTVTQLNGVSRALGPLPAGWVRAIQFSAITASDARVIVYRSTSEGSK
jgi:hypothetical protein